MVCLETVFWLKQKKNLTLNCMAVACVVIVAETSSRTLLVLSSKVERMALHYRIQPSLYLHLCTSSPQCFSILPAWRRAFENSMNKSAELFELFHTSLGSPLASVGTFRSRTAFLYVWFCHHLVFAPKAAQQVEPELNPKKLLEQWKVNCQEWRGTFADH